MLKVGKLLKGAWRDSRFDKSHISPNVYVPAAKGEFKYLHFKVDQLLKLSPAFPPLNILDKSS